MIISTIVFILALWSGLGILPFLELIRTAAPSKKWIVYLIGGPIFWAIKGITIITFILRIPDFLIWLEKE